MSKRFSAESLPSVNTASTCSSKSLSFMGNEVLEPLIRTTSIITVLIKGSAMLYLPDYQVNSIGDVTRCLLKVKTTYKELQKVLCIVI